MLKETFVYVFVYVLYILENNCNPIIPVEVDKVHVSISVLNARNGNEVHLLISDSMKSLKLFCYSWDSSRC